MAIVVELVLEPEAFDLGRATSVVDDVHVELERVVPTGGDVLPFLWARTTDPAAFERGVLTTGVVQSIEPLSHVQDRVLYHVAWEDAETDLTRILNATNATILRAEGGDRWTFELRFGDNEALRGFHDACKADGIDFHVERVRTLADDPSGADGLGLTDEQHDALVAAVDAGYFEVPRGTKLAAVADALGISEQAASERVRRGANAVLRSVLFEKPGEGTD